MDHQHWVLTIQWPTNQGPRVVTRSGVLDPPPDATRSELFEYVYASITTELGYPNAPVMFWACEAESLSREPAR